MPNVEVEEDEPWYSWRTLGHAVEHRAEALDPNDHVSDSVELIDSFDRGVYLALETLYAGFTWCRLPGVDLHANDINLDAMNVLPAGRGGLVALTHDPDRVSLTLGARVGACNRKVQVCTLSGRLLHEIDFVSATLGSEMKLFGVGWVGDDCLVLASAVGLVHVHHLGHRSYTALSLGGVCERDGLAEMRTSPDGIFFRTTTNRFGAVLVCGRHDQAKTNGDKTEFRGPLDLEISDFYSSGCAPPSKSTNRTKSSKHLESTKQARTVHCFAVIPSVDGHSGTDLIVAADSHLFRVNSQECIQLHASGGPFLRVCPSPNGLLVAALAAVSDCLVVVDMSGSVKELVELKPHGASTMDLRCLAWCGSEAVVASFEGREDMLVVRVNETSSDSGAGKTSATWTSVGIVHAMSSELDGVCIVGQDRVQMCRIVPDVVKRVLGPGSTSPGALLHDSRNLVGRDDARAATELLNVLDQDSIREAAADCLQAAGWCVTRPSLQESLMRAGICGQAFGSGQKGENYVRALHRNEIFNLGRSLRILNALVEPELGMPLTLAQYGAVGLPAVINRLCTRGEFLLALRISEFMEHECRSTDQRLRETVLLAWAKWKISSATLSTDDDELLREIRASIDREILFDRDKKGRNVRSKVSWSRIAEHALECGRPRLAAALIEIEPSLKKQVSILLRLGRTELAMAKAKADGDGDSIWEVLQSGATADDDPARVLRAHYDSCAAASPTRFALPARHASEACSSPAPSDDKFLGSARAASTRLLQLQKKIESSSDRSGFCGLSVIDTIRRCYDYDLDPEASRLIKEFKVSDRQAVLVRLRSLVDRKDWVAICRLGNKLQNKNTGLVGSRRPAVSKAEVIEMAVAAGARVGDLQALRS